MRLKLAVVLAAISVLGLTQPRTAHTTIHTHEPLSYSIGRYDPLKTHKLYSPPASKQDIERVAKVIVHAHQIVQQARPITTTPVHYGLVNWTAIAQCESGNDWQANTGNGYFGGLQMDMTFWRSYGGSSYAARPDLASEGQQIAVAARAVPGRGLSPWPYCGRFG